MRILFFIMISAYSISVFSQDKSNKVHELEVHLADMCPVEEELTDKASCSLNPHGLIPGNISLLSLNIDQLLNPNVQSCNALRSLQGHKIEPLEIVKKDEDGETWKIKFFFGFTRTSYAPTDLSLSNNRLDVVIKDFEFDERTSANHYNILTWDKPDYLWQWIDEPTNTFAFSLESKKNVLYITAFHPKFLKKKDQVKHVVGTVDGVAVNKEIHLNEPFDGYNNQRGEMYLVRFENTHRQMDWQVGYGRKLVIFDDKKKGRLTYIPRADIGFSTGRNYTSYVKEGEYWDFDSRRDEHRIQGMNASVGHRVEYERKRSTFFVDQKVTASKLKHGFLDGEASYKMLYSPVTFGVGFNIYKSK